MKRIFKFIPNHYKGGDIILTRQDENDEWKIDVFSHSHNNYIYTIRGKFSLNNCCKKDGFEYLIGNVCDPFYYNCGDVVYMENRRKEKCLLIYKSYDNSADGVLNFDKFGDIYSFPILYDTHRLATVQEHTQKYLDLVKNGKYIDLKTKSLKEYNKRSKFNEQIKITSITEDAIIFNDGSEITFDHEQDCCEKNYADFSQLEDLAKETTFTWDLNFEICNGGFRFGNLGKMFFIPCYSEQNGYYTKNINIYYNNCKMISFDADVVDI